MQNNHRPLWLKNAPSGWSMAPLGSLFRERNEATTSLTDAPLSVTKSGVVDQLDQVAVSVDGAPKKRVHQGDIVINSRSDRKGSAGEAPRDGSVSVINTVLIPERINKRFAHHLIRSMGFQEEFYRFGSGIVADLWSTRWSAMKNIALPLPPVSEQRQVADYLDHEIAEIDATIREQARLVDLIRERQSASIDFEYKAASHRAPKMLPVKCSFVVNPPISHSKMQIPEKSTYLPMSAIGEFGPIDTSWSRPSDEMASGYTYVENGDVLLAKVTPCFENGKGAVVSTLPEGVGFATTEVTCFRPIASITSRYLSVVLRTSRFRLGGEAEMTGAGGLKRVPDRYMMNFRMTHLEVPDQQNLVDRVDKIDRSSQELIDDLNSAIALAHERRAALITAAVTGQIDVTARHKPAAEQLEDDIAQGLHREN